MTSFEIVIVDISIDKGAPYFTYYQYGMPVKSKDGWNQTFYNGDFRKDANIYNVMTKKAQNQLKSSIIKYYGSQNITDQMMIDYTRFSLVQMNNEGNIVEYIGKQIYNTTILFSIEIVFTEKIKDDKVRGSFVTVYSRGILDIGVDKDIYMILTSDRDKNANELFLIARANTYLPNEFVKDVLREISEDKLDIIDFDIEFTIFGTNTEQITVLIHKLTRKRYFSKVYDVLVDALNLSNDVKPEKILGNNKRGDAQLNIYDKISLSFLIDNQIDNLSNRDFQTYIDVISKLTEIYEKYKEYDDENLNMTDDMTLYMQYYYYVIYKLMSAGELNKSKYTFNTDIIDYILKFVEEYDGMLLTKVLRGDFRDMKQKQIGGLFFVFPTKNIIIYYTSSNALYPFDITFAYDPKDLLDSTSKDYEILEIAIQNLISILKFDFFTAEKFFAGKNPETKKRWKFGEITDFYFSKEKYNRALASAELFGSSKTNIQLIFKKAGKDYDPNFKPILDVTDDYVVNFFYAHPRIIRGQGTVENWKKKILALFDEESASAYIVSDDSNEKDVKIKELETEEDRLLKRLQEIRKQKEKLDEMEIGSSVDQSQSIAYI